MSKTLNKKLSTSSKLVKTLFRHHSNAAQMASKNNDNTSELLKEVDELNKQVAHLKATIHALQLDAEEKDIRLANLARDKEKLSMDLLKTKRKNTNLSQQLDDERQFYFKEKESYCHEMNEFKKLKKTLSTSTISEHIESDKEFNKMKKTLEQTLETNYNLSIKFLRMKETKTHLNKLLTKAQREHKMVVEDLRYKIETLSRQFADISKEKLDSRISPSNKKYLLVVNHNSSLLYDNLCLTQRIDHLQMKLKRHKLKHTRSDPTPSITNTGQSTITQESRQEIIKIFERKKTTGTPIVTFLKDEDVKLKKKHRSVTKLKLPSPNDSKLTVFQVSELQSTTSSTMSCKVTRKRSRSAPKIIQTINME